jgi:hypothetical protein
MTIAAPNKTDIFGLPEVNIWSPVPPAETPELEVKAMRFNTGKPKLSFLLSAGAAMKGLAHVFEYGAQKYARNNWMKGLPLTEVTDSLLRHLTAFIEGEENCPESGLPHVNHVLWNAFILAQLYLTRPDLDDRSQA